MSDEDFGTGRDRRGRWRKGFCPNPNGRPRKKPAVSDSDVGYFKQTLIEATINGQKRWVTRHELLLHSMFDQALKGKTSIARKLFERFEDVDMTFTKARDHVRKMRDEYLNKYHETGEHDEELATEILNLQEMLNFGFESKPPRKPRHRPSSSAANWRKRPKPQFIIDLEAEWAAAEKAKKRREPDDQ